VGAGPRRDCRQVARLLRARGERPRHRSAAEQRDELAALQSIELHLLRQPVRELPWKHTALARIK
jgi:hypothetical protein